MTATGPKTSAADLKPTDVCVVAWDRTLSGYQELCEEKRLAQWPDEYRLRALQAKENGKAFCPSCCSAGISNCSDFTRCESAEASPALTGKDGANG